MEFQQDEIATLSKYYDYREKSGKDTEYEVLFKKISYLKFESLLKFLKNSANNSESEWDHHENNTSLDIFYHDRNRQIPIRHSVNKASNISKFCKSNTLANIPHEITYKSPINIDGERSKLDIDNYDIRINLKNELVYNKEMRQFIGSSPKLSKIATNKFQNFEDIKMRDGEKNLLKTFRLKNRFSFMYNSYTRVDLTIVKSSKKYINDSGWEEMKPVKEFIDSNLVNEEKSYEIEIEFFPNAVVNIGLEKFNENLKEIVTIISQVMNDYPILTSMKEKNIVKELFKNTIKTNHKNIIEKKLEIIKQLEKINTENEKPPDELSENIFYKSIFRYSEDEIKQIKNDYTKLLSDIRNNKGLYIRDRTYFIGPKVVSLELKDIRSSNINSIVSKKYTVTDKADGLGMLLFIVGGEDSETKGKIYLIDNNLIVYGTQLQTDNVDLFNTVLNGEYLRHDKNGKPIHEFKIYDAYINKNIDLKHLPLISNDDSKSRIGIAKELSEKLSNVVYTNINTYSSKLNISVKHFEIATSDSNIFDKSKIIWDNYISGKTNYKYDGMIYTPLNEPVGFKDDNINFDLNTNNTWRMNFKWKPPNENTIDFLIQIEKNTISSYEGHNITNDKIALKSITTDQGTEIKRYKNLKLYIGDNEKSKNGSRYIRTLFIPKTPFDKEANICKLFLNRKDEIVCNDFNEVTTNWEPNSNMVKDDTIVEFAYRKDKDKHFKWIPIKNRHDKTYSYKLGVKKQKRDFNILQKFLELANDNVRLDEKQEKLLYSIKNVIYKVPNIVKRGHLFVVLKKNKKTINEYYPSYHYIPVYGINYGNDFNTANSVWRSIHNPVTEKIITTGENIPDESEEKYYRRDVSQKRSKSLTISLQHFHNIIVKNYYLIKPVCKYFSDKKQTISLLDLACGKGGDLPKWIENKVDHVVGIDINRNNIYDENDGARVRLENYRDRGKVPKTYFLVGDSSKSINNGEAFRDKGLWRKLWEKNDENDTNYLDKRFNIVTMMFALHYMFGKVDDLDNLIDNIYKNLKNGGYFIGACLDGQTLFDLLRDKTFDEEISGNKDAKIIWKIKKKYKAEEFKNSEESLNYPIDVYMNSINSVITEYLVNFEYFKKKLEEKNIKLLNTSELEELNIKRSTGLFSKVFEDLEKNPNNRSKKLFEKIQKNITEGEKQISFMSRYFIFKKISKDPLLLAKYSQDILDLFNNVDNDINDLKKHIENNDKDKIIERLEEECKKKINEDDDFWKDILQELNIKINDKLQSSVRNREEKKESQESQHLTVKKDSIQNTSQLEKDKHYNNLSDIIEKNNKFFIQMNKKFKFKLPTIDKYQEINSEILSEVVSEKGMSMFPRLIGKLKIDLSKFVSVQKLFDTTHPFIKQYNNLKNYIENLEKILKEKK